jgi:hypothetical protein
VWDTVRGLSACAEHTFEHGVSCRSSVLRRESISMSRYRLLKGIARSAAHSFCVSCEHFAFVAMAHGKEMEADLLSGRVEPAVFRSARNTLPLGRIAGRLPEWLRGARIPERCVMAARLRACFEAHGAEPSRARTRIEVTLTEDRDRPHLYVLEGIVQTAS